MGGPGTVTVALLLTGHGLVAAGAAAVIAFGIVRGPGRLSPRGAAWSAAAVWLAIAGMPAAGLLADELRSGAGCRPGGECYDYFVVWLSLPAGWLVAILIVAAAVAWGRARSASR